VRLQAATACHFCSYNLINVKIKLNLMEADISTMVEIDLREQLRKAVLAGNKFIANHTCWEITGRII